jgi:hypothetical protein
LAVVVMAQNTSTAVMQRRVEPHDSLDFFPTPPWATRALCEHVLAGVDFVTPFGVWEPACGEGHMARPLGEYFPWVLASDVHPYGFGAVRDFLMPDEPPPIDWVITNPPFRLAAQFIKKSLGFVKQGVAVLVRGAFLEGVGRYQEIYKHSPPAIIAQFAERVPMIKGRCSADATTATAYCWLVWCHGEEGTKFIWIPPCRKQLEREGDYD